MQNDCPKKNPIVLLCQLTQPDQFQHFISESIENMSGTLQLIKMMPKAPGSSSSGKGPTHGAGGFAQEHAEGQRLAFRDCLHTLGTKCPTETLCKGARAD